MHLLPTHTKPKLIASLLVVALSACAMGQRFKTVQQNGIWWLQSARGEKIFSLGCCLVDPGTAWTDYDTSNPSYAGFKYYVNEKEWATDAVSRLTDWKFNTIGAWSDYKTLLAVPNNKLYMIPIMHMGSAAGAPWLDMWDPGVVKIMDEVAHDMIKNLGPDPRIIGYFSDNEMGWWKGAMFDWVWKQKTLNTRRRAVDLISEHYHGNWAAMTKEFEPVGASNFVGLKKKGQIYLRPGAKGVGVVTDVMSMLAQRYYSLCRSIIKKYDPGALYMGDRYISNYYPEIAAQAGKYCDVVTSNLNPDWADGGFVRCQLESLEALTHKPLMVTEYYMTARENRSGNGNNHSGFPVVDTQAERAQGFKRTTLDLTHLPYLVGAHWFQYYDEPQNGRGDGENYDFGLVDTSNKPYEQLVQTAQSLDLVKEHARAKTPREPNGALPSAPAHPDDMTAWDRDDAYCAPIKSVSRGDLYASWTSSGLDLALFWKEERFAEGFYRSGKVPPESFTTLSIDVPSTRKHWLISFDGAKKVRVVKGSRLAIAYTGDTSSIAKFRIPSSAFGGALSSGQKVSFNVRLVSESRAYTTEWHVTRPLAPR